MRAAAPVAACSSNTKAGTLRGEAVATSWVCCSCEEWRRGSVCPPAIARSTRRGVHVSGVMSGARRVSADCVSGKGMRRWTSREWNAFNCLRAVASVPHGHAALSAHLNAQQCSSGRSSSHAAVECRVHRRQLQQRSSGQAEQQRLLCSMASAAAAHGQQRSATHASIRERYDSLHSTLQ